MTVGTKFILRVAGYGFLLFLATMIGLFAMSVVLGSEQPIDYPVTAILLAIAIPNQTTGIVFGRWSTYLLFIFIPAGAWLAKQA